jgi:hypothetical protein
MTGAVTVVAVAPDLMDRSRITSAVPGVRFVTPGELAAVDADVLLLDLSRPGVLELVGSLTARTVGFCPHVDDELAARAREAGCDEVLARSVFFRRLPDLCS